MKIPNKNRDMLILSHLRRDSRGKLTTISRKTRVPVSTIFDRINRFKNCGFVSKYTALLNFEKLGYIGRAVVLLKASREDRHQLGDLLSRNKNVNSLFKVNNGWDYMAELVFPGMKEVETFLESLEGKFKLKKKIALYVIEELKREAFLNEANMPG